MARQVHRLEPKDIEKHLEAGRYPDGAGLYLQVGPNGNKSWLLRFMRDGRAREMGLGPLHTVGLLEARKRARKARLRLLDGVDPIAERDALKTADRLAAARSITFEECAAAFIKAHRKGWRNEKHAEQWQSTLDTYAGPVFGALPVQAVDAGLVIKVLEPIWPEKTETASRLRGRIEKVLDWAKVRGYRDGENPARWRGHLDKLLPKRRDVQKVEHFAALPYAEIGTFMQEVCDQEGNAALALQFVILTACRTSEAINARWDEIDLDAKVWTIPGSRMKSKREHRVPLTDAAIRILKTMHKRAEGQYVFAGGRPDKPLSSMALLALLKRMGRDDLTTHGFRSTFRDWAAEMTNFPREVAEMALAHVVTDQTEAAYRRGGLFEKRRKLMQAWAEFCRRTSGAKVTPINGATAKRSA
jgi:integrase